MLAETVSTEVDPGNRRQSRPRRLTGNANAVAAAVAAINVAIQEMEQCQLQALPLDELERRVAEWRRLFNVDVSTLEQVVLPALA